MNDPTKISVKSKGANRVELDILCEDPAIIINKNRDPRISIAKIINPKILIISM